MKKNVYSQFKEQQRNEVSEFISENCFFAFDREQFLRGLNKFGLTEESAKEKLVSIPGGGFCLKSKSNEFCKIINKQYNEEKKFLKSKKNLITALIYEFGNHECQISHRWDEATEVLGINYTKNTPRKKKSIIQRAKRKFWSLCIKNDWF